MTAGSQSKNKDSFPLSQVDCPPMQFSVCRARKISIGFLAPRREFCRGKTFITNFFNGVVGNSLCPLLFFRYEGNIVKASKLVGYYRCNLSSEKLREPGAMVTSFCYQTKFQSTCSTANATGCVPFGWSDHCMILTPQLGRRLYRRAGWPANAS